METWLTYSYSDDELRGRVYYDLDECPEGVSEEILLKALKIQGITFSRGNVVLTSIPSIHKGSPEWHENINRHIKLFYTKE